MLGEKDVLSYVLRNYCNVNARDDRYAAAIRSFVQKEPQREALFRSELTAAIENNTMSAAEFERLTGEDFDTHEDLVAWLKELRDDVFGGN